MTRNLVRNENLPSSFSCNSLTIIECISADGSVLPSFIIFKSKELMEDWFTHTELLLLWALTTSSAGFTTDNITYKWIKYGVFRSSFREAVCEYTNYLLIKDY